MEEEGSKSRIKNGAESKWIVETAYSERAFVGLGFNGLVADIRRFGADEISAPNPAQEREEQQQQQAGGPNSISAPMNLISHPPTYPPLSFRIRSSLRCRNPAPYTLAPEFIIGFRQQKLIRQLTTNKRFI